MLELNLELNHTYLMQYGRGYSISSATILMITDKAYRIRWNNGLNSTDTWELKTYMDSQYSIVEDVSDFMESEKINKFNEILHSKIQWKTCPNCNGKGTLIDTSSTAGSKICIECSGTGKILDVVNIFHNYLCRNSSNEIQFT